MKKYLVLFLAVVLLGSCTRIRILEVAHEEDDDYRVTYVRKQMGNKYVTYNRFETKDGVLTFIDQKYVKDLSGFTDD